MQKALLKNVIHPDMYVLLCILSNIQPSSSETRFGIFVVCEMQPICRIIIITIISYQSSFKVILYISFSNPTLFYHTKYIHVSKSNKINCLQNKVYAQDQYRYRVRIKLLPDNVIMMQCTKNLQFRSFSFFNNRSLQ